MLGLPPKCFLLVPVCRQVLRQPHLKDTQAPSLAHERGATADSSPEPSAKTWGCVQHRSSVSPLRLWIQLLLFLQTSSDYPVPHRRFSPFSYPLRPKTTKTLPSVWGCASQHHRAWGFFSPHRETILLPHHHQIIPSGKSSVSPLGLAEAGKVVNVLFTSWSFHKVILN